MSTPFLTRLQNHIAGMAPHQRDRRAGLLLIEAEAKIRRLVTVLEALNRAVDDAGKQGTFGNLEAAQAAARTLVSLEKVSTPLAHPISTPAEKSGVT